MADSVIPADEPPDENEAFENVDESLDDEDALGAGPEGERDFPDLPIDQTELEEIGANLDDPDELPPVLSGGIDDPDEPDLDAEEDDFEEPGDEPADDGAGQGGTAGEVVDTADPLTEDDRKRVEDLTVIDDDAPGVDSARW